MQATLDIEYLGAFRVLADGQSTSDYAIGRLGYNPDNNSIFMAGHAHHNAIAEFEIPSQFSFETQAANIPAAAVLKEYVKVLNKKEINERSSSLKNLREPSQIANNISSNLNIQIFEKQELLEILDIKKRLEKIHHFIEKETSVLSVEKKN